MVVVVALVFGFGAPRRRSSGGCRWGCDGVDGAEGGGVIGGRGGSDCGAVSGVAVGGGIWLSARLH
jgi:hypothetical protein